MNPNTPEPTNQPPAQEPTPVTPVAPVTPSAPEIPVTSSDALFPTSPQIVNIPEQPAPAPQQPQQQPELKKPMNKKTLIIIASIIAAALLIIGVIILFVFNNRATAEDYTQAQVLVDKIEAQNVSSREAFGRSVVIASTEMTTEPISADDFKALLAYDRKAEIKAANEKLATETEALEKSLAELKDSPALKDREVRKKYDALSKNADEYVLASKQLIEDSPKLADIVSACFQPDTNIGSLFTTVLGGIDDLQDKINGVAYNPDTAVADFDAKPLFKRCSAAIAANNEPFDSQILEPTHSQVSQLMTLLRQQVVEYADLYKKGDKEAAAQSYLDNNKKIEALYGEEALKTLKEDSAKYEATVDIETPAIELEKTIADRLKELKEKQ